MNIWIVTIGSSDVQLHSDKINREKGRTEQQRSNKVWSYWYEDTKSDCYDIAFEPKQPYKDLDEYYRIESRVLGTVYESSSKSVRDEIWSYLTFPLLDSFVEKLHDISPDAIAVLLTDQSEFFKDDKTRRKPKCPYWQDTYTLELILARYFQDKFPDAKREWITLPPSGDRGLADWDYVLKLVGKKLGGLKFDGREINTEETNTVYVSHQAGTPAISSAVQFMSLARFGGKVQFLVSNEYENQPLQPIKSSEYLRGIQVQQAKGLIKSGTPGAALQLLELEGIKADIDNKAIEDLEKLVDFFNLNRSLSAGSSEFDIEPVTQQIVDAVNLIEKLFEQENYLQGIALLASAQETFLKCAITNEIKDKKVFLSIDGTSQDFKAGDLITWMREGLKFITNDKLASRWSVSGSTPKEISKAINNLKRETLEKLQFPVDDERFTGKYSKDPNTIEKNEFLLKWLCKLRTDFQPWQLLQWSCIDKNEEGKYEDDIRNKLMHNLQGVKKEEVVKYLLGNKYSSNTKVIDAYNTHVKPQFFEAIRLCGLPFTEQKLAERLQDVADAISVKSS